MEQQLALQPAQPVCFNTYFSDVEYSAKDRRARLVQQLVEVFSAGRGWELLSVARRVQQLVSLELDYVRLQARCASADLTAALDLQPAEGINCISAACHEVWLVVEKWLSQVALQPLISLRCANAGPNEAQGHLCAAARLCTGL